MPDPRAQHRPPTPEDRVELYIEFLQDTVAEEVRDREGLIQIIHSPEYLAVLAGDLEIVLRKARGA